MFRHHRTRYGRVDARASPRWCASVRHKEAQTLEFSHFVRSSDRAVGFLIARPSVQWQGGRSRITMAHTIHEHIMNISNEIFVCSIEDCWRISNHIIETARPGCARVFVSGSFSGFQCTGSRLSRRPSYITLYIRTHFMVICLEKKDEGGKKCAKAV